MRGKTLLPILLLLAGVAAIFIRTSLHDDRSFTSKEKVRDVDRWTEASRADVGEGDIRPVTNKLKVRDTKSLSPAMARNERLNEPQAVKNRLREMMRKDDDGLEIVTMPDGHKSIHLKGRFQHISRLVVAENGRLVPACGAYVPEEVAGE